MSVLSIALVFAVCLHGHDELRDFPVGRTHMVYELRSAEEAEAQCIGVSPLILVF